MLLAELAIKFSANETVASVSMCGVVITFVEVEEIIFFQQ